MDFEKYCDRFLKYINSLSDKEFLQALEEAGPEECPIDYESSSMYLLKVNENKEQNNCYRSYRKFFIEDYGYAVNSA
jgi:hypothetical protein